MFKNLITIFYLGVLILSFGNSNGQNGPVPEKYHDNGEVQQILKSIQQSHASHTKLYTVATSPGGEPITVIEIGNDQKVTPAIFAGANFEGDNPLATEGALRLARLVADSVNYRSGLKWYILALPNPDAAKGYFTRVKYGRTVNDFAVNNDMDESLNEDGFEDLNGDGWITRMRVKDMTGAYIQSPKEPRIMVKADARKNERGEYKVYTEGIDNDEDGEYNEDGEGGINVGIGFPQLFPKNNKEAGLWPGQTPEVYGIMKFIFDRPNIAMVFTLGSSNSCMVPPKGGRKGEVNPESIKIPTRYINQLGADPARSYTMDEVIELLKQGLPSQAEITPSFVYSYLGLGAAINPMEDDLKFYGRLSDDYTKYLKKNNISIETIESSPEKDGSFELWAYYQLGLPSFSMNLFSVPKVKETRMNGKEGDTTPKPDQKKEAGDLSEKDKALLSYADIAYGGKGFVQWEKYHHPGLGDVEIGGFIPYLESTPKPEKIDSLLKVRLPWLLQLSKKLPHISLAGEKITPKGAGVYQVDLFIENKGYLPYPIAIGERNKQPAPVIIVLEGDAELLEGLKRTPLGRIGGNQVKKMTWLIKTDQKLVISVKLESAVFGSELKQIKIGG
jgi:hypothetical protein